MAYSWKYAVAFAFGLITAIAATHPALAALEVDDIGKNIVKQGEELPGAVAGFSYLCALIFAITGILKLKEHVGNPTQVKLSVPVIRFLIGGALLALPIIYEAMAHAINGGANPSFDPGTTVGGMLSGLLGSLANIIPTNNANNVFSNIIDSLADLPGLISGVSYLLALVLGATGLLKLKEHVENPEQTGLREGVVRLLVGGALFAIPTVYTAMFNLFPTQGMTGGITSIFGALGMIYSSYGMSACTPSSGVGGAIGGALGGGGIGGAVSGFLGTGSSLGDVMCGIYFNAGAFTAFLTAIAYLIGLFLGVWGILKIKAHVIDPRQTSLWEGVARLLAGGAFFALPVVVEVLKNTMAPMTAMAVSSVAQRTSFNEKAMACDGNGGLDGALYCFMADIFTPAHVVMNFFATCAGFLLAMIGISRMMKSAQDGARAPGGLGTIMTFAAAGCLLSYNALMRTATVTLTMASDPMTARTSTKAFMQYTEGMTDPEKMHVHTVISAILKFMIIVGLVSFLRGIFIIRGVAEGNSQASIMAGITHMVGGALAVNLGPLLGAVQQTLGISAYGISFS